VIERFEFESIYQAQLAFDRYYKWYNEKRRHRSLGGQTPDKVWKNYSPIPFENKKRLNYL
jgi:putative transposase